MIKFIRFAGVVMLLWAVIHGCIEPYDPPLDDSNIDLLVVNGFLDASAGTATIALSRTQPVKSTEKSPPETGAYVYIEDDMGMLYPLSERMPGNYYGVVSGNDTDTRYRLVIETGNGREYVSGFIAIVETPPLDSISYSITNDGVQFEVNTHDPTNVSRHYRWKYVETYEYHSPFTSNYMFTETEIVERPPDQAINVCWKTNASTNIIVGSNQHLKESVTSKVQVAFVPKGSIKLTVKYSLLVQQQALTPEEYNYWLNLQKSTEQLGGLFDPLPSEVTGNIKSTTSPAEKVLGYFGGGIVRELRRTVRQEQLPREVVGYNGNYCVLDTLLLEDIPNVSRATLFIGEAHNAVFLIGYTSSTANCIDCRVSGGTTEMPAFWE
jgi:hypothetical protein